MQRKFHGSPYISSNLTTLPLITMDSFFRAPWTHESFCPTTLQFLSLRDSNDMTSYISYADPGPGNRTICWLIGAWPRFKVKLAKQIPVLLVLLAIVHEAWTKVSPEVVWEGARTRFPHLGDVWWFQVVRSSTLPERCFSHFPVPRSLLYCLHTTLLEGQTLCFYVITQFLTILWMLVAYFSLLAWFKIYLTI